jgi:hypothetical protein
MQLHITQYPPISHKFLPNRLKISSSAPYSPTPLAYAYFFNTRDQVSHPYEYVHNITRIQVRFNRVQSSVA